MRVNASLPPFHSMLPGSATASLLPAMHRRSSAISGASSWLPDLETFALGQKQTYAVQKGMSALPPKADLFGSRRECQLRANSGRG